MSMVLAMACWGCMDESIEDVPATCVGKVDEDRPDLPLTHQTEHLDIYVDEGEFMCAGSPAEYEHFVTYVASELGIEIQRRIPMYAMRSTAEYCSGSGACTTYNGTVYSRPWASYHELTHGVACEIRSGAPPLLAEGLAVAFEPESRSHMGDPESFAEESSAESVHYFVAGHFVRGLLERGEPETFRELYRGANFVEGVWNAIEDAYGLDIGETYQQSAPFVWRPHRQCADVPVLEPQPQGWQFEATLDCESESTLGPYERVYQSDVKYYGDRSMYQSFLIEVEAPGTYIVERTGATRINYERCLDDHLYSEQDEAEWAKGLVWFTLTGDIGELELEPGLWRFDVIADHGPPVDVSVTLTLDPG